jgi:DHA1 family bicyclomycin/chloramphenicol resistance-like MFS transporter
VLLALVVALVLWTAKSLPETLPRELRNTLHPRALWSSYRAVLSKVDFLLLALIPTLNFCAFFLYIASAPTFLIDLLGLSSLAFAWLFVPMIAGVMIGATLSGRLAGRLSPMRTIRIGYAIMFTGASINLLVCWLATPGVPWNVLPILVYASGSSLVMPSVTIILLDLFPTIRGMASSLQGFVQFSASAVTAGTVAPFVAVSVKTLALGMAAFTTLAFAVWLIYQYRARAHLRSWRP